MRTTPHSRRFRRTMLLPAALIPLIGLVPAVAGAEPTAPAPPTSPATSPAPPPPDAPTTVAPPSAPVTTPQPTNPPAPTTSTTPATPTTIPPQGPPGRLTVGAVRIVDRSGAPVPRATAFVQGCTGGPGASLADGGATTVTGQCVRARIDRVPTNWRVVSPMSQTSTTNSGRAEFRFVLERTGTVPPTTTPPEHSVRFTLAARDQNGSGVASQYAVYECDGGRPLGGARTDGSGNGGGEFPGGCITVVPTGWPASCVLLGPHMYSRVVGNGVNDLRFRFRCGMVVPPGEAETHGVLIKTDRITGSRLAGAAFAISRCGSDETVRAVTTGADGLAAFALPAGCYKATETVAPKGYLRDSVATAFGVRHGTEFAVPVTNSKIGAGPVVRNPSQRVPISSIPSGSIVGAA